MNTQTLELDLSKEGLGTNLLRVGQGDKGGTTLKALIFDGGAEVTLSGYTAYLEVLLPNRTTYYRAAASVSGNAATVTVDESKLCQIAGYTDEAYFTFEKSGTRYSTERFAIEILRSATAGQQPAQSYDDAIDNLISRGATAVNAANAAASSANQAASAANSAAARVESAISNAANAANAANNAATRVETAINNANSATNAANTAATKAWNAASAANSAATGATNAASTANGAATNANAAASSATEAAADATAATANAVRIANSLAASLPASDDSVAELKSANAVLATALAGLQDKYVIVTETAYAPASRVTGLAGETLTCANASMSGETATLN